MNTKIKKIWITGASSGIGKELAIKFAKEGWEVAASARRKNLLEELKEINNNIKPFPLDITKNEDVKETFKKIIKSSNDLSCHIRVYTLIDISLKFQLGKTAVHFLNSYTEYLYT